MNKENDEKLMIFDGFIDTESKPRNLDTSRTASPNLLANSLSLLSVSPSRECINHICDMCDLQSHLLDTQSCYGQTLLGSHQSGND